MKILNALVVIAAMAFIAAAQRAENNTDEQLQARNAPDVFVAGVSAFGPDEKGRSTFIIDVNNTGEKVITAIDWEYYKSLSVTDIAKKTLFKFRTDAKIAPGEKKRLTERVGEYSNKLVAGFRLNAVRVLRVEYADGSSWQRPDEDR